MPLPGIDGELLCRPNVRKSPIWIGGVLLSVCVAVSCDSQVSQAVKRPTAPSEVPAGVGLDPDEALTPLTASNSNDTNSLPEAKIELVESSWDELQTLIAKQQGKIVVVDVWSTACEPCMQEFPHLVALQRSHPDSVAAISFDVDFAGIKNKPVSFYRERVIKFLNSMGASQVKHLMCTTAADELFNQIGLDSIPAVYVYDQAGRLAKRFQGSSDQGDGVSYEKQVVPLVEELIRTADGRLK